MRHKKEGNTIPSPEHGGIKVRFCDTDYVFRQPRRLDADEMKGHIFKILAKMTDPIPDISLCLSEKVAASDDIETDAMAIASDMSETEKVATIGGQYLATRDMFNFICLALNIKAGARAYAEDHYDHAEMVQIYIVLQGALLRPRGGIGKDMETTDKAQTPTDSTDTENAT